LAAIVNSAASVPIFGQLTLAEESSTILITTSEEVATHTSMHDGNDVEETRRAHCCSFPALNFMQSFLVLVKERDGRQGRLFAANG
jgi:hypothetical protein